MTNCFWPHLLILPARWQAEALPTNSVLHSLYESLEEDEQGQEVNNLKVVGLGKSFEVSAQQEEQRKGRNEDGGGVFVLPVLLYSR